jgi:hypothetical protein
LLSKKKGAVIGRAAAYRSLKKLGRLCNHLLTRDEARRIAVNIAERRLVRLVGARRAASPTDKYFRNRRARVRVSAISRPLTAGGQRRRPGTSPERSILYRPLNESYHGRRLNRN